VERHTIQPANAKGQQRPLILETPELALDGGTTRVELSQRGVSPGISG
jgi:hypothetical protein